MATVMAALADQNATEDSKPLISLDLHAETGTDRHRGRRMTLWDQKVENYKVIFNKTIAGRYKEGETGYDEIGVLLITWEKDDLLCRRTEVPRLRDIFQNKFGYAVEEYRIPSQRSGTGLAAALATFAHRYDSPNKMAIVYYGGHGDFIDNRFGIYAKQVADGEGDPSAFLDDALSQLKLPDTDILTIIDCCYAARAFSRSEIGKRKFELLAATPATEPTRRPDHEKSFTTALCDTLEELLDLFPRGFTTSKLYQQVYFKQEDDRKPLLFDQSTVDYGKIWLRPFRRPSGSSSASSKVARKDHVAYVDLRLKLSQVPEPIMMNQLAVAMQYLPHVEEVSFQNLQAPYKQLEEFISGVRKANLLRPLVAKLRLRRTLRIIRERGASVEQGSIDWPLRSPLHTERRGSSVYDWSSCLQGLGSTKSMVASPPRIDSPLSMPAEEHEDHPTHNEALEGAKVHHVGTWFSFVYALDISGLKEYFVPVQHQATQRVHTRNENIIVLLSLALLLLICIGITRTPLRDIFCD